MAEDESAGGKPAAPDPAGLGFAMGAHDPATAEEVRAYLREQTRLARLQGQNLVELNAFEMSHLKWRRFNDQMRGALQMMLVAIGVLVVVGIAAAIWSAARDDSVVIDAFAVPPDLAQKGLTGDVAASELLDRLASLQARIDSSRAASTYAGSGGLKVEIPDTGVSIGEAYRYLAGWLGNQTHISGEIYRNEKGIVLTTRVGANAGAKFAGPESDLDTLIDRAAENIYRQTQPFRYSVYLQSHNRLAESEPIQRDLAFNGPRSERPWAFAVMTYYPIGRGDIETALAYAQKAVELDPDLPLAQVNLAGDESIAGHEERELLASEAGVRSLAGEGRHKILEKAANVMAVELSAAVGEETGDYAAALSQYGKLFAIPDFEGTQESGIYMAAADDARLHDLAASRRMLGARRDAGIFTIAANDYGWNLPNVAFPRFEQMAALGDWQAARADLQTTLSTPDGRNLINALQARLQAWPWLALAEAKTGDAKAAWALIGQTPLDCYLCLRVRGEIAAAQKNWNGAAYWFEQAATQDPSIPFAYTDWGAMLLAKGDTKGAIAKFETANDKAPHFADPLEMWGEALVAENRSDLALAKFAEAARYAPHWGRLHLKWGEALVWAGKPDEARKQFALAAGLDLSATDRTELARARLH
ncbi:MAG TPA: hypothetical protein VGG48_05490 [Rhizomicrobium sp.]